MMIISCHSMLIPLACLLPLTQAPGAMEEYSGPSAWTIASGVTDGPGIDHPCQAADQRCEGAPAGNPADEGFEAADEPADAVHDLLGRLEESAADLQAFTAEVVYEAWEDLLGRREIRTGRMIYRVEQNEQKVTSFAIMFDALVVGQRRQERLKHYVFRDRWLVEIDHEARQFIKREIVPPGRQFDPLKLGEGPIPMPIGQPRDEVLRRFDVSLVDPPDSGLLAALEQVYGLRLVPREGVPEADDYQHIDLFYDRETLLLTGINAIEFNDNRKTVRLSDLKRNPRLSAEQLGKLSVDEPDPRTWSIDVRPYRRD